MPLPQLHQDSEQGAVYGEPRLSRACKRGDHSLGREHEGKFYGVFKRMCHGTYTIYPDGAGDCECDCHS